MPIAIADLLCDLRQDHRNMLQLLDLLQQETNHVRDDEAADIELILDIMRYMTTYSDAVHHPKEDVLYACMLAERPGLAEGLEAVGPDHERLAELGAALRADLEAIAADAPVSRDQLLDDARDYVVKLRRHIAWEEEDLFRRADEIVNRGQHLEIDVESVHRLDPVFGPERQHAYTNLLRAIANEAGL